MVPHWGGSFDSFHPRVFFFVASLSGLPSNSHCRCRKDITELFTYSHLRFTIFCFLGLMDFVRYWKAWDSRKDRKTVVTFYKFPLLQMDYWEEICPFFSNIACWFALMLSEQWWENRTSYWGQGLFFLKYGNNLPKKMILCFSSELWIEAPATPKCGTWTSSISSTQKPAGDAGSWALLQTYSIRISRDLWFNKLPNNSYIHSQFKTT